jgi:hypothetical protein
LFVGTDRLEHGRPGEVLGRDQLDLPALPVELAPEQLGDLRVDLRQPCGLEVLDRFLCDGHSAPLSSLAPDGTPAGGAAGPSGSRGPVLRCARRQGGAVVERVFR